VCSPVARRPTFRKKKYQEYELRLRQIKSTRQTIDKNYNRIVKSLPAQLSTNPKSIVAKDLQKLKAVRDQCSVKLFEAEKAFNAVMKAFKQKGLV